MKRKIKRELRYIRYKVCRNIYYADQCPNDCRKNYRNIGESILMASGMFVFGLMAIVIAVLLA